MLTFGYSISLDMNRCAVKRGFSWWVESFRMLKGTPFKWFFVYIFYRWQGAVHGGVCATGVFPRR
jgi:hypothetical protein